MAVVLLRLKLAIQRRQRGSSPPAQAAALWLRWTVALVLGVAAGAGLRLVGSVGESGDLAVLVILLGVFLGWVVLPVVVPGLADTSVDPARLEQFPLTATEQVAGLLLGGVVAPTGLFTFTVASGGAALPGEAVWARLAAVVVAVVFTVSCVAASRAVLAGLSSALSTRRGRDVAYVALGVASLAIVLVAQDPVQLTDLLAVDGGPLADVLTWLPAGSTGRALEALRDGEPAAALGFLGLSIAWVVVFGAGWVLAIRSRVGGSGVGLDPHRRRHADADLDLLFEPLRALRPTPARAAMAQHGRYFFARSPRATQAVLIGVVGGAFVGHATVASNGLVAGTAFFVVTMAFQLGASTFSYDDQGFAWALQVGAPMAALVRGKATVAMVIATTATVLFVAVEATIGGSWSAALPAVLAGTGATAATVGTGAYLGMLAPFNQETPAGGRSRLLLTVVAGIVIMLVAFLGVAAALDQVDLPVTTAPGALVALVCGLLLGTGLVIVAGRRAARDPWRIAAALGVT